MLAGRRTLLVRAFAGEIKEWVVSENAVVLEERMVASVLDCSLAVSGHVVKWMRSVRINLSTFAKGRYACEIVR